MSFDGEERFGDLIQNCVILTGCLTRKQIEGNSRPKRNSVCDGYDRDEWNERVLADDIESSYFRFLTSISFSDPYLT